MNYSEALEQQVALARWLRSPQGAEWFDACNQVAKLEDILQGSDGWTAETISRLVNGIERAETYYWSPELCDVLEQVMRDIPSVPLTPEIVPSADGFCWFGRQLCVGDAVELNSTALVWAWTDSGLFLTPLMPTAFRTAGVPMGGAPWAAGHDHDCVGDIEQDWAQASVLTLRKLCAAIFLFMDQRILVSQPHVAERHVRKRLEHDGWKHAPVIRVVQLRRRERSADRGRDHADREWSCQWVVRGHWRQQWHPKQRAHKPKWILPYVKGPEDKPLKPPRATVFAVVR